MLPYRPCCLAPLLHSPLLTFADAGGAALQRLHEQPSESDAIQLDRLLAVYRDVDLRTLLAAAADAANILIANEIEPAGRSFGISQEYLENSKKAVTKLFEVWIHHFLYSRCLGAPKTSQRRFSPWAVGGG